MFAAQQFLDVVCGLGGIEQQYRVEAEEDLGCQLLDTHWCSSADI